MTPGRAMNDGIYKLRSDSPLVPAVLRLIQAEFAYMETRIDPPSSMLRMSEQTVRDQCATQEVWVRGTPPNACVFLTVQEKALYVGKLAVATSHRGQGHARQLIAKAEERARALRLPALVLETRIELTENHAAFARLGFRKTAEGAHDGYDRPTYIRMQKDL